MKRLKREREFIALTVCNPQGQYLSTPSSFRIEPARKWAKAWASQEGPSKLPLVEAECITWLTACWIDLLHLACFLEWVSFVFCFGSAVHF